MMEREEWDHGNVDLWECGCLAYVTRSGTGGIRCHCGVVECERYDEHHGMGRKRVEKRRVAKWAGPRRYRNEETAERARKASGVGTYVYNCVSCERWHVGDDMGYEKRHERTSCEWS